MFYLMNQDNCIASFFAEETPYEIRFVMKEEKSGLFPIGFRDIGSWIKSRKAISHSGHLRRLAESLGCADDLGYLRLTHAGSLNDTFWVKEEGDTSNWSDISYYSNPFSEIISKAAFEGTDPAVGDEFSPTIPEISTAGSFPKCWSRDHTGRIWLIKGGSTDLLRGGFEPWCEVLASEVYQRLTSSVQYELTSYAEKTASRCLIFTDEKTGFVPISKYGFPSDLKSLMDKMEEFGFGSDFRAMLIADCLTFNPDRHRGNFGFLVDNLSLKPVRLAPAFDFNQCFFPYGAAEEEIVQEMSETWPKIGRDFVQLGRQLLTADLRKKLLDLSDYRFHFRGDDQFSPERVLILERLLHEQIHKILE